MRGSPGAIRPTIEKILEEIEREEGDGCIVQTRFEFEICGLSPNFFCGASCPDGGDVLNDTAGGGLAEGILRRLPRLRGSGAPDTGSLDRKSVV